MAKKVKKLVKSARPNRGRSKPAPKTPKMARISASVEKDLLAQVERFAAAHDTTVAALVAEGLRRVVGAAKAPVLPPGDIESSPALEGGPWGQLLAWMEEQQSTLTEIRNALGDVAASLPNDSAPGENRPTPGPRIPPL